MWLDSSGWLLEYDEIHLSRLDVSRCFWHLQVLTESQQVSKRIATALDSSLLLSFFDPLVMTCCSTIFGTTAIQSLGHQRICGSFLDESVDEVLSRHSVRVPWCSSPLFDIDMTYIMFKTEKLTANHRFGCRSIFNFFRLKVSKWSIRCRGADIQRWHTQE